MSWLKFDLSTPEKTEVLAITVALGWDDPDLTVGKLLKVWRWFDQHTVEGNAPSVTTALLDRIVGVTGMSDAMIAVGWLVKSGAGLQLPNFDRHNGKTTKDRLLTAKRVASHKGNAKGNATNVTQPLVEPLPREEKRREEGISPLPPSGETKAKSVRGTRLPENWGLDASHDTGMTEDVRSAAKQLKTELEADWTSGTVRYHLNEFRNHFHASAQRNAVKLDWLAAWRNWCSKAMREMPSADPVRRDRQAAAARQAEAVAA